MYDEFEQDDSWLRGGPPRKDQDDDGGDDSFDWLADSDAEASPGAGRGTGLTGELDWLRAGGENTPAASAGDSPDFSWADDDLDTPAPGQGSRTGVTGELSWLGGDAATPDWLSEGDAAFPNPFDDDDDDFALDVDAIGVPVEDDADSESASLFRSVELDERAASSSALFASTDFLDDAESEEDSALFSGVDEPDLDESSALFAFDDPLDDADVEDDAAPGWLSSPLGRQDASAASASPADDDETPSSGRDIPDWLRDSLPTDSRPPAQDAALTGDSARRVEVPDWLDAEDAVEEEVADEHPTVARQMTARDIPDWLRGEDGDDDEDRDPEADPFADDSVVAWASDSEFADNDDEADLAGEASALPNWLMEDESPGALPDWLSVGDEPDEVGTLLADSGIRPGDSPDFDLFAALDTDDLSGFGARDDDPLAALLSDADGDFDLLGQMGGAGDGEEDDLLAGLLDAADADTGVTERVPGDNPAAGVLMTGAALDDLFADMPSHDFDFGDEPAAPDDFGFDDFGAGEDDLAHAGVAVDGTRSGADDFDWSESPDADLFGAPPAARAPAAARPADDADDMAWLRDIGRSSGYTDPDLERAPAGEDDLDSYLANLQADLLPDLGDRALAIPDSAVDFDSLFADPTFDNLDAPDAPETTPAREAPIRRPDFLSGVTIGEVSAASIVRGQQDRPLEELPDRLLALRDEGLEINAPTSAPLEPLVSELLPGDAIAVAAIPVGTPGLTGALALTPEQRRHVEMLRAAAALDAAEAVGPGVRARPRLKLGHLLLALLLGAAVALPFFPEFRALRIGSLPPARFVEDTPALAAFEQIQSLPDGALVLFAVEYGPTTAAELDDMTEALLRHLLLRGARPVIISGNPVGLLRADLIVERLGDGLTRNVDYVVGRYITADAVGLRGFSANIAELTRLDREGRPTNLAIRSLDDFALIIVVAEQSDGVRGWAEQVAPLTRAPLLFAVSQSAAPLAVPYARANSAEIPRLLVGYRDAYTYTSVLDALLTGEDISPLPAISPTPSPTVTPTETLPPTPSAVPSDTPAPTATDVPTEASTEAPTEAPTQGPTGVATDATTEGGVPPTASAATNTPTASATVTPPPTETTAPTASATLTASATVTPSPMATSTPTPTATPETFGIVNATQTVNVRSGPGTSFAVVGTLAPRSRVKVLEINSDRTWYRIEFPDVEQAWISATLLGLEPTPTPSGGANAGSRGWAGGGRLGARALPGAALAQLAQLTATADLTTTSEATNATEPTATAALTPAADLTPTPEQLGSQDDGAAYRDERWYGMTLGLAVAIVVIVVGNILNILGNLGRRRVRRGSGRAQGRGKGS